MKLSIIIPAYNEEREIGACLLSVQSCIDRVDMGPFNGCEIIVVDNNSDDATATIAGQHGATVVFEPVNQIAGARNAGARAAGGDWLLFIDADSRLATTTLEKLIEAIVSEKTGAGGSTIAMPDAPLWGRISIALWNIASVLGRCAAGSFIFVSKPIFDDIEGFDTQYFAAEELYFSRRVRAQCRKLGLRFVILVGSPHQSSARKFYLYSRSELARQFFITFFSWSRTIRSRQHLDYFYDGRREAKSSSTSRASHAKPD